VFCRNSFEPKVSPCCFMVSSRHPQGDTLPCSKGGRDYLDSWSRDGAAAMSSPIFLGERLGGPTLGASDDVAPTSPPVTWMKTFTTCFGLSLVDMTAAAQRTAAAC
jgi:hypothetical protein